MRRLAIAALALVVAALLGTLIWALVTRNGGPAGPSPSPVAERASRTASRGAAAPASDDTAPRAVRAVLTSTIMNDAAAPPSEEEPATVVLVEREDDPSEVGHDIEMYQLEARGGVYTDGVLRGVSAGAADDDDDDDGGGGGNEAASAAGSAAGSDTPPGLVVERRNSNILKYLPPRRDLPPSHVNQLKYRIERVTPDNTYVFGMRDPTAYFANILRVRVPFHNIVAVEDGNGGNPSRAALVLGKAELPASAEQPPYLFDSSHPEMLLPEAVFHADRLPIGRRAVELAITARHLEYEFFLADVTYRLRVLITPMPGHGGRFGDILVDLDEGGAEGAEDYQWYDRERAAFCASRPDDPARLVDTSMYAELDALYRRGEHNVLPIPVNLLTTVDWDELHRAEGNLTVQIDLSTDTALMFRRRPPRPALHDGGDSMHKWIAENLCFPALTSSLFAIVRVI